MKDLDELPHNARLFTADVVSMYTNINTKHGIQVFREWLINLKDDLPSDFLMPLFLRSLRLSCPRISSNLMICFFVKKEVQQWGQALLSSMLPFIMVIMKRLP
jgi:hypothetical protein